MAVNKKYGGRTKGTPNKITNVNRAFISDLLNNQGNSIELALQALYDQNKQAYLSCIVKMLEFIIPRLTPIEAEENEEQRATHVFKLKGTDKITFNGN